jgi:hypothetical protein
VTTPQPKTATEALEIWRRYNKSNDDPMVTPQDIYYAAYQAVKLAEKCGSTIHAIAASDDELAEITADAATYEANIASEDAFYASLDDPRHEDDPMPDDWLAPGDSSNL